MDFEENEASEIEVNEISQKNEAMLNISNLNLKNINERLESFIEKDNMEFVLKNVDEAIFRIQKSENNNKRLFQGFSQSKAGSGSYLSPSLKDERDPGRKNSYVFEKESVALDGVEKEMSNLSPFRSDNGSKRDISAGSPCQRSPKKLTSQIFTRRRMEREKFINGHLFNGMNLVVDIKKNNRLSLNFKKAGDDSLSDISSPRIKMDGDFSNSDQIIFPEPEQENYVRVIAEKVMPVGFFPNKAMSKSEQTDNQKLENENKIIKSSFKKNSGRRIFSKIRIAHKLQQKYHQFETWH